MRTSVVLETWNIDRDLDALSLQLDRLALQLAELADELVITHTGIVAQARADLAQRLEVPVTWVELTRSAGYYDHKNRGFDASTGEIVAFIDGDCVPSPGWLEALLAPFAEDGGREELGEARGHREVDGHGRSRRPAQVVAGATAYAGPLAALGSELDFPYFDARARNRSFAATAPRAATAPVVRNFFANNVAFARDVFATRRYPTLPMFHGQCQVLALRLVEAGIPITYAHDARVTHAWPDSLAEWLEVRLLRGADTTRLLPHVLATYAPRATRPVAALGPLPALAVFASRAVTGARTALRASSSSRTNERTAATAKRAPGHRLPSTHDSETPPIDADRAALRDTIIARSARGLGLVATCTLLDTVGALAAPLVYRAYDVDTRSDVKTPPHASTRSTFAADAPMPSKDIDDKPITSRASSRAPMVAA